MNRIIVNQIIEFLMFSGFTALANIFLRIVLSDFAHLNFYIAISVSYFIGMIVNFSLNKKFNFQKVPRKYVQEMRTFFIVALFGLF
ncbi:MAG: hypothetical protein A2Z72_07465 [Omnitrophica bacterium RBG_13_46_9]|nr:MAG: hypothetical protein A2Z72_07465 [Omnitrophica bacterium RBG_13_46_9]